MQFMGPLFGFPPLKKLATLDKIIRVEGIPANYHVSAHIPYTMTRM